MPSAWPCSKMLHKRVPRLTHADGARPATLICFKTSMQPLRLAAFTTPLQRQFFSGTPTAACPLHFNRRHKQMGFNESACIPRPFQSLHGAALTARGKIQRLQNVCSGKPDSEIGVFRAHVSPNSRLFCRRTTLMKQQFTRRHREVAFDTSIRAPLRPGAQTRRVAHNPERSFASRCCR